MILDTGICTVFRAVDVSEPGGKPTLGYVPLGKSWFGEVSFETSPARPTEGRLERRTDAKIRIHQMRSVRQDDLVIFQDVDRLDQASSVYRIIRAYHGKDDDGPTLITDLSLEVYEP